LGHGEEQDAEAAQARLGGEVDVVADEVDVPTAEDAAGIGLDLNVFGDDEAIRDIEVGATGAGAKSDSSQGLWRAAWRYFSRAFGSAAKPFL
jgi:hypothetical protein